MNSSAHWLACERCRIALARLESVLKRAVFAEDIQLRVLASYLISQGGKRLRPSLVLLAASYGSWNEEQLLGAAAALELIHVASLYHDDVMDRATLRRNVPSVNARWGNSLAALSGTFLVARAMTMLGSLGRVPNRLASEASKALADGQLMEIENAYNLELSVEQHLDIIKRKTATLFELPLRLGACLAGASNEHSEALTTYGQYLGLAFQLADDALDLTGDAEVMGKNPGTDLREGVYGLAVLSCLQTAAGRQLRAILEQVALSESDIRKARQLLRDTGAVAAALKLADDYVGQAQSAIEPLPSGAPRDSLHRLAEHAIRRIS